MSRIVNDIWVIAQQPEDNCELCGKIAELRPYGPNDENISFECGQKNIEITNKHIKDILNSVKGFTFNV